MKNLKILDNVHQELKVFAAINNEDMSTLGSAAIADYLKFRKKNSAKKSSTKKLKP